MTTKPLADRVSDVLPCECVIGAISRYHSAGCMVMARPAVLALLVELRDEIAIEADRAMENGGWLVERLLRIGEPVTTRSE